jgi:hypothetical protein
VCDEYDELTSIFIENVVQRPTDPSDELCPRLDASFVGSEYATTGKPRIPPILIPRKAVRSWWPPIPEAVVPMHFHAQNLGDARGRLDCTRQWRCEDSGGMPAAIRQAVSE